jgi:plastocyanin
VHISRWLPVRLSALVLTVLLAVAFVVTGCGTTSSTAGSGGSSPTATTAPTNTVPVATNTPASSGSGTQAAISVTGAGGAYSSFGFSPSSMSIKAGTTVTWTDKTGAPHTVTSDAGDPASFNGSLSGNGATFSFTFTMPGTYTYHCNIHPYMTATITATM